jgi:hypothetical protein
MHNQSAVIFKLAAVSLALFIGCSQQLPTAQGGNVTDNCVGTVKDATGSPVAGASIVLVPERHTPLAPDSGNGIDSATSDEYGRYGFNIDAPGSYNLLAKGKWLYAMRTPIRISANARVVLDDEILLPPGSLTGTVCLQGESDHRGAIILLMGTNAYAKAFDSAGAFSVAALAQGSYTLRVLTANNEYAPVETTVVVMSGKQTALPCIELRKKFVPMIDSLSVVYDSPMMRAILIWPAVDTSKITHFAVYCNRSENLAPIAKVNKSSTTISFDIIASPIDTFQYQISAFGKDGIEGPSAVARLLVKTRLIAARKITVDAPLDQRGSLFFDRHEHIFVSYGKKIVKLDSNGNFLGEFLLSDDTGNVARFFNFGQARVDTAGNIYALAYSYTPISERLVKIDSGMHLVREIPIDGVPGAIRHSIAVSAAGSCALYASYGYTAEEAFDYGTHRWVYDQQFNLMERDSVSERLFVENSAACNDTTVVSVFDDFQGRYRIVYCDNAFKGISSPVKLDFRNRFEELSPFVPAGYSPVGSLYSGSKNCLAVKYCAAAPSPPLILFIDDRMRPVARMPYDDNDFFYNLYFDRTGNLYGLSSTEKNTILKYPTARVLTSDWK